MPGRRTPSKPGAQRDDARRARQAGRLTSDSPWTRHRRFIQLFQHRFVPSRNHDDGRPGDPLTRQDLIGDGTKRGRWCGDDAALTTAEIREIVDVYRALVRAQS